MFGLGPGYRVLIVDDQATQRPVARDYLEGMGHRVTECPQPEQARAVFRVMKPDVVRLDVEMPGLDCYTLARQIHGSETGSWTHARVCSTSG
jgi:CheY-like chemotaxis protein